MSSFNYSSYPRNINIASVFFKAGYVESWGRGTTKIISACLEAGLPDYQEINDIGKSVSASELQHLVDKKMLVRIGNTGRSTKYVLPTGKT